MSFNILLQSQWKGYYHKCSMSSEIPRIHYHIHGFKSSNRQDMFHTSCLWHSPKVVCYSSIWLAGWPGVPLIYTVRSRSFRTVFFLNNTTRVIYQPTQKLSTINQHPFTCRVSFVYLNSVRVIICLVQSVFSIHHGWQKRTERCHNILFQSQSTCDRNTGIGTKGLWEWGSEPTKHL
jgi:hypothetical protein